MRVAERQLGSEVLDLVREVVERGGHVAIRAEGLSMLPAIRPGDEVVLGPMGEHGLQVGEVVAWLRDGVFRVHRVVRVTGGAIVTRGDAVGVDDGDLRRSDVFARVKGTRRPGRLTQLGRALARRWSLGRGRSRVEIP